MKIKLNTNLGVNLIVISIAIYIALPFFKMLNIHLGATGNTNVYNSWQAQHTKPIGNVAVDENLPYRQYIKLRDSILIMRDLQNGDASLLNRGGLPFIGITFSLACDTCGLQWNREHGYSFEHKKSYITLPGWTLITRNYLGYADEGKFYVKNGQGYVRKTVLDTSIKRTDGSVYNKIHIADMPVNFRYDHVGESLLIPITNSAADTLIIVFRAINILLAIYALFLMAAFVKIIIDISKGQMFTAKNVNRLKLIAISLLVYPIFIYLLNYSMKFIFHGYFIYGLVTKDFLQTDSWKMLGLVIIFLLLFKAFRQAKKLKEEHDLTI